MNLTNEHIVVGILTAYILYKYYHEKDIEENMSIVSNSTNSTNSNNYTKNKTNYVLPNQTLDIPTYNKNMLNVLKTQPQLNSSCKMPDKQTAKCVADMLVKTGCVKCSLDSCDKNKTISASCYENETHSCSDNGHKMFENMHDSMHSNQFNGMHASLNNTIYNPMRNNDIPNESFGSASGNYVLDDCDLEESNSFNNLNQENSSSILKNGYGNDNNFGSLSQIEDFNKRPTNNYAQNIVPQDIGLQRSLDGSFFKYSRLG